MSAWVPFESSQETNDLRAFASPSCLCDADDPHDLHLQRCAPAFVLPLRFISSPQDGHFLLFTADLPFKDFYRDFRSTTCGYAIFQTHFLSRREN